MNRLAIWTIFVRNIWSRSHMWDKCLLIHNLKSRWRSRLLGYAENVVGILILVKCDRYCFVSLWNDIHEMNTRYQWPKNRPSHFVVCLVDNYARIKQTIDLNRAKHEAFIKLVFPFSRHFRRVSNKVICNPVQEWDYTAILAALHRQFSFKPASELFTWKYFRIWPPHLNTNDIFQSIFIWSISWFTIG